MIQPGARQIIAAVACSFAVPSPRITGDCRSRRISRARQAGCLLLRWLVTPGGERRSFPMVAAAVGRTDHSTALHACRVATKLAASDPHFAEGLARALDLAMKLAEFEAGFEVAPLPEAAPEPAQPRPASRPPRSAARLARNRFDDPDDGHGNRIKAGLIAGSASLLAAIEAARAA